MSLAAVVSFNWTSTPSGMRFHCEQRLATWEVKTPAIKPGLPVGEEQGVPEVAIEGKSC